MGISSIAECRTYVEEEKQLWESKGMLGSFQSKILSQRQLIGLQYADEFDKRIPREEVTQIETLISDTLRRLPGGERGQARAVGSYRRGAKSCGDVDILISVADPARADTELIPMVPQLVATLMHSGFVTHLLTGFETSGTDPLNDRTTASFMGVCKLPARITVVSTSSNILGLSILCASILHRQRALQPVNAQLCRVSRQHWHQGLGGAPRIEFSEGFNSFSLNDQGSTRCIAHTLAP